MKNIHVLPTDKPSNYVTNYMEKEMQWQNIYITSDEEIKEGDYVCASDGFRFVKALNNDKARTFEDDGIVSKQNPSSSCHLSNYKKIILTSDQDLIKDGVQAIDDDFLEWFVKNPSCEKVEVGHGFIKLTETDNKGYWVSIPDEEFNMEKEEINCFDCNKSLQDCTCMEDTIDMKQESIEEAAERLFPAEWDCYEKESFIEGAQWQAERMYSEEQMIEFGFSTYCYISELMGVPFNLISENKGHAMYNFEKFKNKQHDTKRKSRRISR